MRLMGMRLWSACRGERVGLENCRPCKAVGGAGGGSAATAMADSRGTHGQSERASSAMLHCRRGRRSTPGLFHQVQTHEVSEGEVAKLCQCSKDCKTTAAGARLHLAKPDFARADSKAGARLPPPCLRRSYLRTVRHANRFDSGISIPLHIVISCHWGGDLYTRSLPQPLQAARATGWSWACRSPCPRPAVVLPRSRTY